MITLITGTDSVKSFTFFALGVVLEISAKRRLVGDFIIFIGVLSFGVGGMQFVAIDSLVEVAATAPQLPRLDLQFVANDSFVEAVATAPQLDLHVKEPLKKQKRNDTGAKWPPTAKTRLVSDLLKD